MVARRCRPTWQIVLMAMPDLVLAAADRTARRPHVCKARRSGRVNGSDRCRSGGLGVDSLGAGGVDQEVAAMG